MFNDDDTNWLNLNFLNFISVVVYKHKRKNCPFNFVTVHGNEIKN